MKPIYVLNGPNLNRLGPREPEIIGWTHEAIDEGAGIIINAAALTFTSLAILDALKMFPGPVIELHISNIHRREKLYQNSLLSRAATAVIVGLGAKGYPLAVGAMLELVGRQPGR